MILGKRPQQTISQPQTLHSAKPTDKRKKPSMRKKLIMVFSIMFLVLVAVLAVLGIMLHQEMASYKPTFAGIGGIPYISSYLQAQRSLFYGESSSILPFVQISYSSRNVSYINVVASYYDSPPPTHIFVLNWSNQCYQCGDISAVVSNLSLDLGAFGLLNGTNKLSVISRQSLSTMPANSILIILNGLMPDYMVSNSNGSEVPLTQILSKGVTVMYIGRNFSRLVSEQDVIVPAINNPGYLTTGIPSQINTSYEANSLYVYAFNNPTFVFSTPTSQATYGPITYESVGSGSLVAFSNYLNTWPNTTASASDISQAISSLLWLPSFGTTTFTFAPSNVVLSSGIFGNVGKPIKSGRSFFGSATAYGKIAVSGVNPNGNVVYDVLYYTPKIISQGSLSMPSIVIPNKIFNATISVFTTKNQFIEPHMTIYNTNLTEIRQLPPLFAKNITPPAYTVISTQNIVLPPGGYIASIEGFSNQQYASAYFIVPNVTLGLAQQVNATAFNLSATMAGVPLNDVNATVSINNNFYRNVTIKNGYIMYALPSNSSIPGGALTFTANVLGRKSYYVTTYTPVNISINPQYIEFIFAMLIVVLEITLIKAPVRDDFFIDVPSLPKPESSKIKIKSTELIGVFDKLNYYYHWHFMPLSKSEFRFAVANNIRINNMPITLTYSNIDEVLNGLTEKGYIISADELYAPTTWIEQSKHDIEYLATFKKLRLFLVSNGHIFTDLDKSDTSDIVTTLHNERAYIVVYSSTSRFMKNLPIVAGVKTYIVFLNEDRLEEFRRSLYDVAGLVNEQLKLYISTGTVVLVNADNPEGLPT
ncbi:MAG: hypothetical protein M1504_01100 [Candidatus Marsarchaeota archaeon]|nr:hypothetical protein [Candidatus Marsarchaeota archaeon]